MTRVVHVVIRDAPARQEIMAAFASLEDAQLDIVHRALGRRDGITYRVETWHIQEDLGLENPASTGEDDPTTQHEPTTKGGY